MKKPDLDNDTLARIRAYNMEQEFLNECNEARTDRMVALVMISIAVAFAASIVFFIIF